MNSDPICNAMEYGSVSSNHVSITFNSRPAILGTPSLVCKVDLFAPLLGDIEAIILCSFDFDLKKKKNPPARSPASSQKKVVEDNQTIIFF